MSCHIGVYPLRASLLASLSKLFFGFEQLDQVIHRFMSVSVRVWGSTYIDRPSPCHVSSVYGTVPISISHLPIISMSVWVFRDRTYIDRSSSHLFEFELGPHLYRSVIHPASLSRGRTYIDRSSSCQFEFSLSQGRTYIDRPFSYSFEFSFRVETTLISIGHSSCQFESRSHLYRSVIVLSVRVWGRTYIDRPSPCHVSLVSRTAPISIGHSSCQFEFSGAAPILISHFPIRLSLVFESGPHLYRSVILHVNLSWDHTYIDQSLSYQLEFGATPISICHLLVMLVQFLGPHPYRSVIHPVGLSSIFGAAPISIGHLIVLSV